MMEYEQSRRASSPVERLPLIEGPSAVTVVTLLEEPLSAVIENAGDERIAPVRAASTHEAFKFVRERAASVILVSPSIAKREGWGRVATLIGQSPGIIPIAVVAEDDPRLNPELLVLGACGVKYVVNLAEREGWKHLRSLVHANGGDCGVWLQREVMEALSEATDETKRFFATMVRVAPRTSRVLDFAQVFDVEPSTLTSRFFRARLPAPKTYLDMCRLTFAAWFLENPRVSVSAVANLLRYSSPQSFTRHVQITLGMPTARSPDR